MESLIRNCGLFPREIHVSLQKIGGKLETNFPPTKLNLPKPDYFLNRRSMKPRPPSASRLSEVGSGTGSVALMSP